MIDWILGHTDRFKALVSHDGVFNLVSMYGATEELWFPEWEFKGKPWDNPELYEKWSPQQLREELQDADARHRRASSISASRSIRGCSSSPRCSDAACRRSCSYFPDEGHWVLKPQNSRLWYTTALDWFDEWVKK